MTALPPRAVMIQALRRRSHAFDGVFYAAVKSTGIVCRTVCPARTVRAANLTFYPTLGRAIADGYRPCKRCKPDVASTPTEWTRGVLARAGVSATADARLVAGRVVTPLGAMLGVATQDGLVLLEFADRPMLATELARLQRQFGTGVAARSNPHLARVAREMREWFAGRRRSFTTPLVVSGTPFQEQAWAALQRIPHGASVSYQAQARLLGRPGAARAVGRANGDNRIAIVIPCHRVVRAEGTLGGYGGGVWRKQRLLAVEAAG